MCSYTLRKHFVKFGLNYSLDNKVMDLFLVAYYFAIFSERGGQLFCLYSLYISLNGIKIDILLLRKSSWIM